MHSKRPKRHERFYRKGQFTLTPAGYEYLLSLGLSPSDIGESPDDQDDAVALLIGMLTPDEFDESPLLVEEA